MHGLRSDQCVKVFILQEYDHMPPVKLLDDANVDLGNVSTGLQKLKVIGKFLSIG